MRKDIVKFVLEHDNAIIKDIAFKTNEGKGNLPYVVMWVGAHNLPSIKHYGGLREACSQVQHLRDLGCRPSLLQDMLQLELVTPALGMETAPNDNEV